MKKLHFEYDMQLAYSVEVTNCHFTIKCFPENNARQRITNLQTVIQPPVEYCEGRDGLGNRQIYGRNEQAHRSFSFHLSGDARTGLTAFEEEENPDLSMIFRHPHGLNCAGEKIQEYYRNIVTEGKYAGLIEENQKKEIRNGNSLYLAQLIMHQLYKDYRYQANSTTVKTTAEEAFVQGYGVCQDYSHIFIALLHLAGIAARYVTGLLIGEGASHAWVEILQDHKWYGLDPTNDVMVSENHIKIAVGRDANDCMINRGIMHGGGLHIQTVHVSVKGTGEENDD